MGFEPTRAETNGLSFHRLNHSAIFVHKRCDQTVFLYVNFKSTNFHFLVVLKFSRIKNIFTWSFQDFLLQSLSCVPITQKVPVLSPGRITWTLFSTLSSANDGLICSKLTSHPKHRTVCHSFFSYFVFRKFSMEVLAEVFQIPGSTEILIRITGFKLQIPIHYTIKLIKNTAKIEFSPTLAKFFRLAVYHFNYSANSSTKDSNKPSVCV